MASRKIDDIAPECRELFVEFLARLVEAQIPVVIIDTLRSEQEQISAIQRGVSWTKHSFHLAQPPSNLSYAMDVCPLEIYKIHGTSKLDWDATDPIWDKIGPIGEAIGLFWGGRWKDKNGNKLDPGHFQYVKPTLPLEAT